MIFSGCPVPKGRGVVFRAFPQLHCLAKLCFLPVKELAVPSRQSSPHSPPNIVGRTCFALWDVMLFVLQGDRPKWYQFSASLWLPWGSRDCQLVASPRWSQKYIYGGRSQGVLCGLVHSVWWGTACAHALVMTSPPRDVLISPTLFCCGLPSLLGSYTQWVHLGAADRKKMFLKSADLDKEETCPHLTKFTILKFNVKK